MRWVSPVVLWFQRRFEKIWEDTKVNKNFQILLIYSMKPKDFLSTAFLMVTCTSTPKKTAEGHQFHEILEWVVIEEIRR